MQLNYHHLRYFAEVASDGNLTRAAGRLNVSQSALSFQIKQLEDRLGHQLFDRVGRGLQLTEAGQIALDHAERIFATGEDLVATLSEGFDHDRPLRVGAVSTLSRNFQMRFLQPMVGDGRMVLISGSPQRLLGELKALALDVILTTEPPLGEEAGLSAKLIDRQEIVLIGQRDLISDGDLKTVLATAPLILPNDTAIRPGLLALTNRLGVAPRIVAEVDDMAMVRLLARSGAGVAVAPEVVLANEIERGLVVKVAFDLGLTEEFYAVTVARSFPHPKVAELISSYAPGL